MNNPSLGDLALALQVCMEYDKIMEEKRPQEKDEADESVFSMTTHVLRILLENRIKILGRERCVE